jgi:hypothetical protein
MISSGMTLARPGEIVDRDLHAGRAQARHGVLVRFRLLDQHALGDLQVEAARIHPAVGRLSLALYVPS